MKRVIFCEEIVEPPTETLAIRGLCLYLNVFGRESEILLETQKQNRDLYFKWTKQTGLWDFIEEIIYPEYNIKGLRISCEKAQSPYIKIDRISFNNLSNVLDRLKSV